MESDRWWWNPQLPSVLLCSLRRHHAGYYDYDLAVDDGAEAKHVYLAILLLKLLLLESDSVTARPQIIDHIGRYLPSLLLVAGGVVLADDAVPLVFRSLLDLVGWVDAFHVELFQGLPLHVGLSARSLSACCQSHFL